MNNFKRVIYSILLIGLSSARAGSYEDFFVAIIRDDPGSIRSLVQRGFDPNALDPAGQPGLAIAIQRDSRRVLEALVAAMQPYARHGVNVNVDFYSGVIYYLHQIPKDLFVPIFAVGRVPGWTVQVLEQQASNILIRPLTLYNGPPLRPYVPIGQR